MRQKRRGDDICTKSRLDNLSSSKKVGGVGETKEVLNETLEKKQARWGAEELGGTLHHCGNF